MENLTTWGSQPLSEAVEAVISAPLQKWLPYSVVLLIGWPLVTRSLRYRRLKQLHKKYNFPTRESMAKMTDEEAYEIQLTIGQFEFPFMFVKALQFALFRVWALTNPSVLYMTRVEPPHGLYRDTNLWLL